MPAKAKLSVTLLGLAGLWTAFGSPAANAADARFEGSSAGGSVAFFSTTDQLVPGDTDSKGDIYERSFDPAVGEGGAYVTREVSTGPTGGNDAYDASYQGASADGAAVFFSTQEPLVAADRDHSIDVYRHDRNGGTTLVSQAVASCEVGGCGNGTVPATFAGASDDGTKVFFETSESLAPEDTDGATDVYVRDLESEPPTTTLATRAAASCAVGGCGSGPAAATFVGASDSGDEVFFETSESLTPEDTDGAGDIYMRDLAGEPPTTTLVSLAGVCPAGASASECKPKFRAASGDGSHAFFTTSERISGADTDESSDVYVWKGGTVSLVSIGSSGKGNGTVPATFAGASDDGTKVFFQTSESLTPEDTDGVTDVYVRDLEGEPPTTTLVTRAASSCVAGGCGNGPDNATFAGASASGERIFFQTSESLAPADEDSVSDVYVRDLGEATTALVSQPAPSCAGGSCGPDGPALFAGASASGVLAFFTSEEAFVPADGDEGGDVYGRDLIAGSTSLESPAGVCPLAKEKGCDATFAGASEDGARVFFRTAERLTTEDVDSDLDVYERAEGKTRLVSAGNSVNLGPATPVLTATDPASPGSSLTPSIVGHVDPETSIKVYTTSNCSGEVIAGTAAQLEGAGIPASVEAGSTTSFRATATDGHGDTSGCSNAVVYRQEASPPPLGEESGGSGGGGSGGGSGGGGGPTPGATVPPPTHGGIAYVAPVTRITFGPAFKTRASRPVFRFVDSTGQPGTRFVCKVDRRGWKSCASPIRLEPVGAGKHVFEVKGINAAGAPEMQPVKRSFKRVPR